MQWGEQTTDEMCLLAVQVVTDNLADLRKIAAMRGNRLGAVLVGGVDAGSEANQRMSPAALARIATEGFLIPERFKAALARFDLNGNGRLNKQEIDAMPQNLRERIQRRSDSALKTARRHLKL